MEAFSIFQEAMTYYQLGDFQEAEKILIQLHKNDPENKIYSLYHQRCISLIQISSSEWNGVWKFDSK